MNGLAVEVERLTVRFDAFTAVDDISFAARRGEIFGFLGANGAGKTTTIRVLCGLLPPTAGEVRVAGVGYADGDLAMKAKVGYMSQKFTLYNDMTVGENLDFIAGLRKLERPDYLARRKELLEFVSFDRPMSSEVRDLPGGIKQQVALAAALLHDPEIVFLDEPTSGVTPAARERFWELIRRLAARGKTVFVTTHHLDEAEQCGRIALMREGRLVAVDSPAGLKKAAFPTPVFEFDPRAALSFSDLSALKSHEAFSFFEPYGRRFHAAMKSEDAWRRSRADLEARFVVREIAPSMEDVFIRMVEET